MTMSTPETPASRSARLRIGITFDLRDEYLAAGYGEEETAEFDSVETIDAIDRTLVELGHVTDRIGNARQLIQRVARGERWDLVFNICEGLRGIARESQVPAILDVYDIPYTFSDAAVLSLCLHKGMTKTVVRAAGVPTARFAVVETSDDIAALSQRVDDEAPGFPAFAKPVAEGTGKGVSAASRVTNPAELRDACERLLRQFQQPVLVERFLPGREFTIGLLGGGAETRVIGTMEIVLLADAAIESYSYSVKKDWEDKVVYHVRRAEDDEQVARAEALAKRAWQVLGCRDAGRIDIRCDEQGDPQFLEVNPLAGLRPGYSDLALLAEAVGMSYVELIGHIIAAAMKRVASRHA